MTDCVWRVPLGQKEPKSQKHLLLLSDMGVETHYQFTLFHFQLRHFNYRTKTPGELQEGGYVAGGVGVLPLVLVHFTGNVQRRKGKT